LTITTLAIDNHLNEDVHFKLKRVGRVSHIYELLSFYCCAGVEINTGEPQLTIANTAQSLPSVRLCLHRWQAFWYYPFLSLGFFDEAINC